MKERRSGLKASESLPIYDSKGPKARKGSQGGRALSRISSHRASWLLLGLLLVVGGFLVSPGYHEHLPALDRLDGNKQRPQGQAGSGNTAVLSIEQCKGSKCTKRIVDTVTGEDVGMLNTGGDAAASAAASTDAADRVLIEKKDAAQDAKITAADAKKEGILTDQNSGLHAEGDNAMDFANKAATAAQETGPDPIPGQQLAADTIAENAAVVQEEGLFDKAAALPGGLGAEAAALGKVAGKEPRPTIRCGVHGKCMDGKCQCVLLYSGLTCSHPIYLTWPFLPDVMKQFTSEFEGEMVMHQGMQRTELKVFLADKVAAGSDPSEARKVIADADTLKKLLPLLPAKDDVLKARVFDTCAVVGSSGYMLSFDHGKEIDAHDMVMRFNSAPTKGFEKHVGSKTTHRITNTQNWGYHETDSEAILVHARSASVTQGLFWNAEQAKPWNIYAFDPDWVEYMSAAFSFLADSGFYGLILALHRCTKVDLYGFQMSEAQGVPPHYYDECDILSNTDRDAQEWLVFKAFAQAGLVRFGEPCIQECHESAEACSQCRSAVPEIEYPSTEHCDPARVSQGHHPAPWTTKGKKASEKAAAKQAIADSLAADKAATDDAQLSDAAQAMAANAQQVAMNAR
ncbi:hypothetical protein WJX72_000855 [[Myrmecia] bisecta]|uniref:beta-galactoside alpha-(2,6)-sialyltransferase n=1 Tax=[Myrmecia] bisecta TaxID=41462 RepID=A0AAW1PGJ6_9CHLO